MDFKKRPKKEVTKVNAGSMADIAFLLLIFFLVTTTIQEDKGILVKLPKWEKEPVIIKVNQENVCTIYINKQGEILLENDRIALDQVKESVKVFIQSRVLVSKKAIISLSNDRVTSYDDYLNLYNEIKAAYKDLRMDLSRRKYNKTLDQLTADELKTIKEQIPQIISEAELSF